jgi:cytochrome c oxidase assembly protein subunit 15
MRVAFRHLAATTAGLAFGLILLGVYTGATGAGLACAGRWPFCDGFLGLFPANWKSFVEWFHRFVAMVAGFAILGTAIGAWRGSHGKGVRYASTLALGVLPMQVLLGANTIFNFGVTAQMLHHAAAQLIFGSLVVAATLAYVEARHEPRPTGAKTGQATGADD